MGELLRPGDPGYDDARRGYNLLHDLRPAMIARPVDGGDVARALELAAGAGLEVAVRSGGGNFGVATRFRYRPHPIGEVLGARWCCRRPARSSAGRSTWPTPPRTS